MATGGGAAIATRALLGPGAAPRIAPSATVFVPVTNVLAPLVLGDGRLAGYVGFDAELEVRADVSGSVTEKVPLLLHAINMRTYRTPLAAGRDGTLPDIAGLRAVIAAGAEEAFGVGVVRRIAITRAEPA